MKNTQAMCGWSDGYIIANISFGILNSRQYSNNSLSNKLFDMKRVADSISQIAFINIKKTLGNPYSFGWEIEDSYIRDKEIILMQIKLYLPDAIIICGLEKCGSAQKMLLKDLKIDSENFISLGKNSSIKYFSDTNRIIISAYPLTYVYNNHVASREKYCNDIINIVNLWIDAKSRRN